MSYKKSNFLMFFCVGNRNYKCCAEYLLRNKTEIEHLDSRFANDQWPDLDFSTSTIHIYRNSFFNNLFDNWTLCSWKKLIDLRAR